MKTLRKILHDKSHYHVPMGLEPDEALELFKEWIQQKQKEKNFDYVICLEDYKLGFMDAIKEFLEEL